ncbi:unnamed protein product, partial [Brassica oleracea var. botrytis]
SLLTATFNHPTQLRLALLSALGVCYKSRKVAIAYNFAKILLGTNPNLASHAKLTTHVVEATKHNMMDEPLVMSSASPIEIQFYWQEAFSGTTVLSSSSICQLANNGDTTYPVRRIVV